MQELRKDSADQSTISGQPIQIVAPLQTKIHLSSNLVDKSHVHPATISVGEDLVVVSAAPISVGQYTPIATDVPIFVGGDTPITSSAAPVNLITPDAAAICESFC